MKYLYLRVSSEAQDFTQQMQCITDYLSRINETAELLQVVEKVSGSVKHTERKLNELLKQCDKGSTIYISELSRLGRNMSDLFQIITEASEREITIVQAKDGTIIENKSIGGKALLFALSLAAEIELNNIRQRTKAGLDARKARNKEIGGTNNLWGSKKGNTDRIKAISEASQASAQSRREKARMNPANKAFWEFITDYQMIHGRITANTDFQPIADELNKRGKVTSSGLPFDKKRARAMYVSLKNIYFDDYLIDKMTLEEFRLLLKENTLGYTEGETEVKRSRIDKLSDAEVNIFFTRLKSESIRTGLSLDYLVANRIDDFEKHL